MSRRKPKDITVLKNLNEVDQALQELGQIERKLETINNDAEEEIRKAKERAEYDSLPLRGRREELETAIQQFTEKKKELFDDERTGKRSRTLRFGIVGFRLTTGTFKTLNGVTWKDVLEYLKSHGKRQYYKIKRSIDKKALIQAYRDGKLTEAEAEQFGIRWHQPDEVYYETFNEETPEDA